MTKIPAWCKEALNALAFHEHKLEIHGHSEVGNPHGKRNGWSIRDTAKALNISKSKASDLIILGEALKKDNGLKLHSYTYALSIARRRRNNA